MPQRNAPCSAARRACGASSGSRCRQAVIASSRTLKQLQTCGLTATAGPSASGASRRRPKGATGTRSLHSASSHAPSLPSPTRNSACRRTSAPSPSSRKERLRPRRPSAYRSTPTPLSCSTVDKACTTGAGGGSAKASSRLQPSSPSCAGPGRQQAYSAWSISTRSWLRSAAAWPGFTQAAPNTRQGSATASTETAANFSSGCRASGQNAACVSALMPSWPRPPRNSLPQCIGNQACCGPTPSSARSGTISGPRRDCTRTSAPAVNPRRAMSCGCIDSAGAGSPAKSRATVPLRLMPCHWSRSRPVLSASGNFGSCISAVGLKGFAMKRARPSACAKRRSS